MSVSLWQDKSKTKDLEVQEFDIVIIGGGIAGISTAYWLIKENQGLRVALLEKGELASGATGRNAGFITCGSVEHFNRLVETHGTDKALEIWKFSEENLKLLEENIIKENNEKNQFEKKGSFSLASTEEEFTELKKSFELMSELGINVEVLEKEDIEKRLNVFGFVGGIKYKDDASVHPVLLLEEILSTFKSSKYFSLFENSEVFNIEQAGELKRVHTKSGKFDAPILIMATNGYSSQLHPYFSDKIYPTRGQVLSTESLPKFLEGPCYANFVLDYFRQTPTGEVIIGGFRQLKRDTEVGYSDEITDIIQEALVDFLNTHIPSAKGKKITHRWSGIMGFSADGQPMVGSIPSDPQIYFIGGFTAHGMGLAFNSGKCLVDLLFNRTIPEFISAKRFV
ncbi:NAD(P)/FAD-dependent oxidoreductase [Halobacteriovorax sp.]|uniref:NAD(P)/FAD-dependent oxidoreductase n=1 Tax=Halobacteriovorax sp. TaxID=2020862 RepID=UPI0035626D6E